MLDNSSPIQGKINPSILNSLSPEERKKGVNIGYLTCYVITMALGMFQFGYCIESYNSLPKITAYRWDWPQEDGTFFQKNYPAIVTTCTNFGAMMAALGAGPLIKYGKWNMILATNLLVLAAVGIMMVNNPYVILVGRVVYGMASGSYTVFVPKFISEITPEEYRGPFGAFSQFMCTAGIFFVALLGIKIPDDPYSLSKDSFLVSEYWRVLWGLPAGFSCIQVVLMLTVFKYDTPVVLKQKGDYDSLTALLSKLYVKDQVQMRIEEIVIQNSGNSNGEGQDQGPTMKQTFCDPKIRRAAFVGCGLSIFQQLSGINVIIFYSSTIFADTGSSLGANSATALVMGVNCVAVIGATFMLNFAGRRTLMFFWTSACAVIIVAMGIVTIYKVGTAEIILTMAFVCAFEFAPGPIVWLYMGEILNDKGISVAVFLNWTLTMLVGLLTPSLINAIHTGPTFILFGIFNTVAAIFIFCFMKETKGLTDQEVKKLYTKDVIGEFEEKLAQTKAYGQNSYGDD